MVAGHGVTASCSQACMTADGFSAVSKQHSHPALFPFFCRAAYDRLLFPTEDTRVQTRQKRGGVYSCRKAPLSSGFTRVSSKAHNGSDVGPSEQKDVLHLKCPPPQDRRGSVWLESALRLPAAPKKTHPVRPHILTITVTTHESGATLRNPS